MEELTNIELITAISALLNIAHSRFSHEGECQGGADCADAIDQTLIAWQVFMNEASWMYPKESGGSDAAA